MSLVTDQPHLRYVRGPPCATSVLSWRANMWSGWPEAIPQVAGPTSEPGGAQPPRVDNSLRLDRGGPATEVIEVDLSDVIRCSEGRLENRVTEETSVPILVRLRFGR